MCKASEKWDDVPDKPVQEDADYAELTQKIEASLASSKNRLINAEKSLRETRRLGKVETMNRILKTALNRYSHLVP